MCRFGISTMILWACLLTRAICAAETAAEERTRMYVDCGKKVNFPLDKIQELDKRNFEAPIPEEFKCWLNCVYEGFGGLKNGALVPKEEVKLYLLPKSSKLESEYEQFKTCYTQSESYAGKHCELAFKIFKCFKKADKSSA